MANKLLESDVVEIIKKNGEQTLSSLKSMLADKGWRGISSLSNADFQDDLETMGFKIRHDYKPGTMLITRTYVNID